MLLEQGLPYSFDIVRKYSLPVKAIEVITKNGKKQTHIIHNVKTAAVIYGDNTKHAYLVNNEMAIGIDREVISLDTLYDTMITEIYNNSIFYIDIIDKGTRIRLGAEDNNTRPYYNEKFPLIDRVLGRVKQYKI